MNVFVECLIMTGVMFAGGALMGVFYILVELNKIKEDIKRLKR